MGESLFLVLAVKFLEKLGNSKANRKQGSVCGELREDGLGSENVAPSEDSQEPGKAALGKQPGGPAERAPVPALVGGWRDL